MASTPSTAWPLCGVLALAVAGCGGSGGGGLEPSIGAPRSLAAMAGTAQSIASSYEGADRDSLPAAPDSGHAVLDGQIELMRDGGSVMGDLSLAVDFGAGTTQGLAGNFRAESAPVEGTLSGSGQVDTFEGVVTLGTSLGGTLGGERVDVTSVVGLRRDGAGYVGTGYGDGDAITFSAVRER